MFSLFKKEYKFSFTWKIENFSFCTHKQGEYLSSPTFNVDCLNGSRWELLLYPKRVPGIKDHITCYLKNVDLNIKHMDIDFKIECTGKDNIALATIEGADTFKEEKIWGKREFLSNEKLYKEKGNLPHDILIIICYMKIEAQNIQNIEATTKITVDQFSSLWQVHNPNSPEWSESKKFHNIEGFKFNITITCPENDILINVQRLKDFPLTTKFIKCKIDLIDIQKTVLKSTSDSYLFDSKDDQWRFPNFITKGDLQDEKNDIQKKEIFLLFFDFSGSHGLFTETINGVSKYMLPSLEYYYQY